MSRNVMGMKVSGEAPVHAHIVESVHFSKQWKSDDAPMLCSCGHLCLVKDWPEHAKGLSVQRPWSAIGPGKMETWQGPTHRMPDTRVLA